MPPPAEVSGGTFDVCPEWLLLLFAQITSRRTPAELEFKFAPSFGTHLEVRDMAGGRFRVRDRLGQINLFRMGGGLVRRKFPTIPPRHDAPCRFFSGSVLCRGCPERAGRIISEFVVRPDQLHRLLAGINPEIREGCSLVFLAPLPCPVVELSSSLRSKDGSPAELMLRAANDSLDRAISGMGTSMWVP